MASSTPSPLAELVHPEQARGRDRCLRVRRLATLRLCRVILPSVTFLGGERSAGQRWSSVCSFLPLPDDQWCNRQILIGLPTLLILLSSAFQMDWLRSWHPSCCSEEYALLICRLISVTARLNNGAGVCAGSRQAQPFDADLCRRAIYGLPEWNSPAIAEAQLVAAPGCSNRPSSLAAVPEAGLD